MDKYLVRNLFGTNISIAWYAVIMCVGIIAGTVVAYILSKKRGFKFDVIIDYLILAIPLAVICARLYYVVFEWDYYAANPSKIIAVWEGGLAIYGAVIGAVIAALIFCKWRKFPLGHILDFGGCGLIIGQAIGRWGNFVNQEAFGTAVTNPDLQFFPLAVKIDGTHYVAQYSEELGKMVQVECTEAWHLATFFYESMWNLIVFAVLLILFYKVIKRPGNIFALYLVGYGIGRCFIEGLRTDSLWLIPGVIRVSQGLSILLIIAGVIYLLIMRRKPLPEAYYGKYCLDWDPDKAAETTTEETAEETAEGEAAESDAKADAEAEEAPETAGEESAETVEITENTAEAEAAPEDEKPAEDVAEAEEKINDKPEEEAGEQAEKKQEAVPENKGL